MASILEYFNSKPKNTGASTFQTELASNKLINDAMLSDYPTLIGSVADNFETSFTSGIGNGKFPALLMHAADIFWGDATFNDATANNKLSEIKLLKGGRIRTSRDIIAILEYLLKNINAAPLPLPELSLTGPSPTSLTTTSATSTVTAKLSDGSAIVGNDVKWTLTKSSGDNLLAFNNNSTTTTGASATIKVTGTTPAAPDAVLGTITLSKSPSTTTDSGKNIVTATFKARTAITAQSKGSYTIKAEYENSSNKSKTATISCTLTSASSGVKQSGTWGWNIANKPSGITSTENGNELTLINDTFDSLDVTVTCTNKTGNTDNAPSVQEKITVQGKTKPATKYYYLAGIIGGDSFGGPESYYGVTEIFPDINPLVNNSSRTLNETWLKANLPNIETLFKDNGYGIPYIGETDNEEIDKWKNKSFVYAKSDIMVISYYPFIVAPKKWFDNHTTLFIPIMGNPTLYRDFTFNYNGTDYVVKSIENPCGGADMTIYK